MPPPWTSYIKFRCWTIQSAGICAALLGDDCDYEIQSNLQEKKYVVGAGGFDGAHSPCQVTEGSFQESGGLRPGLRAAPTGQEPSIEAEGSLPSPSGLWGHLGRLWAVLA